MRTPLALHRLEHYNAEDEISKFRNCALRRASFTIPPSHIDSYVGTELMWLRSEN